MRHLLGESLGKRPLWHPDARRFLSRADLFGMRDAGSNITSSPAEFASRFGWKNELDKATLLRLGMPLNAWFGVGS